MSRFLRIMGIIILCIVVLFVLLIVYLLIKAAITKDYIKNIEIGRDIKAKYLGYGAHGSPSYQNKQ